LGPKPSLPLFQPPSPIGDPNKMKNNSGFTLVELLVTLGLISIILVVSSEFLINLVNTSVKIQSKNEVEQNYNFIVTKMTKIIQDSNSVVLEGSELVATKDGVDYRFALVGNSLTLNGLKLSSISVLPITNTSVFAIISDNPQQVKVNLMVEKDAGTKFESSQEIKRTITLRRSYKN
jgi:prepilin-type N-terminal cleavage/methylation domain-containing protein